MDPPPLRRHHFHEIPEVPVRGRTLGSVALGGGFIFLEILEIIASDRMKSEKNSWQIRRVDDFPPPNNVPLYCGTCTCCCIFIITAGIGAVVGGIYGARGLSGDALSSQAPAANIGWKALGFIVYGIVGLVVGGALGWILMLGLFGALN